MRRSRYQSSDEELNVWPAFTDLMSNAFMILSLFLILAIIKSVFVESVSEANAFRSQELERELRQRSNRINSLERRIDKFKGQLENRSSQISKLNEEIERLKSPPVIVLRDSAERKFESGSAALSSQLNEFIEQELVEQIKTLGQDYQGYIVEVIGHTDGQVNTGNFSNLDANLEQVIEGNESLNQLIPGSNADLGLMRALAVVSKLQDNQELQELDLKFKAYSAAQLYDRSGEYSPQNQADNPNRRRIEIRFTPPAQQR
ncbi:MAG: hypothetical protein AAFO04_17985 [Cyanobacteria bacterium J06592_8]